MSKNILLTKFSMLDSGELSEKGSINMDSVILSEDIFQELNESYISAIDIFEEDSEEKYTQKVFDTRNLNDIINFFEKLIIERITNFEKKKINTEVKDILLNEMRELLNIRNILLQKNEKYKTDDNVVLVIG